MRPAQSACGRVAIPAGTPHAALPTAGAGCAAALSIGLAASNNNRSQESFIGEAVVFFETDFNDQPSPPGRDPAEPRVVQRLRISVRAWPHYFSGS